MLTIPGQASRFCDGVPRRNFLRTGALGMGGLALPQLLLTETATGLKSGGKSVITIYLPDLTGRPQFLVFDGCQPMKERVG